jgi:hypothetical protein
MRFCIKFIPILTCVVLNTSCGKNEGDCSGVGIDDCNEKEQIQESFLLKGSVVGAFEVVVDGNQYEDIETFYSEEIARLQDMANESGYFNHTVVLDAEVGFKDLTNDMSVFVAPVQNRGYASKTKVSGDDTFTVKFPSEAAGDVYQIRATKRINLIITEKDTLETLIWCYNFSAVDSEVSYEQINKPVVLSSFETKLTKYSCEAKQNTGISIPKTGE